MTQIKLTILQKPRAQLHAMKEGTAKIQINRYETGGGVAHTRYPRQCTLTVFKRPKWLSSK